MMRLEHGFSDVCEIETCSSEGNVTRASIPGMDAAGAYAARPPGTGAAGQGGQAPLSYSYSQELATAWVAIRSFSGDPSGWEEFCERAFRHVRDSGAGGLILDVRDNGGGNSGLGDIVLRYVMDRPFNQFGSGGRIRYSRQSIEQGGRGLPEGLKVGDTWSFTTQEPPLAENPLRFAGPVYLLIDRGSFSSATSFATCIKDYGRGTVVGEETGGLASSYGDQLGFTLPHSGLHLGVSYKHFLRPSREEGPHGVIPDHEVAQDPGDSAHGVDTALVKCLELAAPGRSRADLAAICFEDPIGEAGHRPAGSSA